MLTELTGDGKCRQVRFHAMRNFLGNENLSFLKAVLSNRLLFYLDSPLHIMNSLFSRFCLFQNAVLHEVL